MSIINVDNIHLRLKEEIVALGFSLAKASREMGESGPQRLKDVTNGRQKLPAEMLANATLIGVDIIYVLTGQRGNVIPDLTIEETALVENYRASSDKNKCLLEGVGASFAQQIIDKVKKA